MTGQVQQLPDVGLNTDNVGIGQSMAYMDPRIVCSEEEASLEREREIEMVMSFVVLRKPGFGSLILRDPTLYGYSIMQQIPILD